MYDIVNIKYVFGDCQVSSLYMESSMNISNCCFNYEELDKEIINFVIYEKSNKEIAEKTGYSLGTIKMRLSVLFKAHGVKTKAGLVREIFKKNLFLSVFNQ